MARRTPSSSPDRSAVEEALAKGMVIEDPATGVPVKDMLLDPNVAGVGEEAEDLAGEDGPKGVQAERAPFGIQLLVDTSVEGWEDEIAAAFKAAANEFGFTFNPDEPTEIITRG